MEAFPLDREVPERVDEEGLNRAADVPRSRVMRARVLAGLASGIAGICLGVAGVVFASSVLAILAAAAAVVGCVLIATDTMSAVLRIGTPADATVAEPPAPVADMSPARINTPEDSVVDRLTGFPDKRFFDVAIEGRVAAARRHLWPVSIVLLEMGFDDDDPGAHLPAIASFANIMRETLREADIACRMSETAFGLILEDTSEEGGVWTAERLQIALSRDAADVQRLVAGVAAYPTHGLFATDVLARAQAALDRASSTPVGHGLGQVEVAHVDHLS